MLFSLLKHYLELYITGTTLKVFRSLYCFITSISHGVENLHPMQEEVPMEAEMGPELPLNMPSQLLDVSQEPRSIIMYRDVRELDKEKRDYPVLTQSSPGK